MGGMGVLQLRAEIIRAMVVTLVVRTRHRHDRSHATKGMAAAGQVECTEIRIQPEDSR
jgi:hypothetical protein